MSLSDREGLERREIQGKLRVLLAAGTEGPGLDEEILIAALNKAAKQVGVKGFDMADGGMIGVIERLAARPVEGEKE